MWELFKTKMKEQNPKVEFTGEQWPKLATPDYTSYINAILQAKPDAVFCPSGAGTSSRSSSRRSRTASSPK